MTGCKTLARLLLAALLAWAGAAGAQSYPAKPITWVVGFPPGGGADAVTRMVAAKMAQNMGQSIVVENRPGASGMISAQYVAQASADGYTVLSAEMGALVYNRVLFSKMPYDPTRDFVPVSNMIRAPVLLIVHPSFPAQDFKSFFDMVKKQPGKFSYASPGKGLAHSLAMEIFKSKAGLDIADITYKGLGPATQDVLAGQVPVGVIDTVVALQHVRAGKLKPLAAFSKERLRVLPDVAAMGELGYPDADLAPIVGMVAPAATPRDIINRLAQEVAKAVRDPEVNKKLTDLGLDVIGDTPAQFGALIDDENKRRLPLIRALNIRLD
jgi:tripartite-type tricarboxylate transporter receptor subunit TctC